MLLSITALGLGALPIPAHAGLDIQVGISLPPLILFSSPPVTVVLPGTDVYAMPGVEVDIFFNEGWWWRPWNGHWYRSRSYDRDWAYHPDAPAFYRDVPRGWRKNYRNRQWHGKPWRYHHIPQQQVERKWQGWKKDRYWEKQHNWGIQQSNPQPQGRGQNPRARQSHGQQPSRQGQDQQVRQSGHQTQQTRARKKQIQQPNSNNENQGRGNQGHGRGNQDRSHGKNR